MASKQDRSSMPASPGLVTREEYQTELERSLQGRQQSGPDGAGPWRLVECLKMEEIMKLLDAGNVDQATKVYNDAVQPGSSIILPAFDVIRATFVVDSTVESHLRSVDGREVPTAEGFYDLLAREFANFAQENRRQQENRHP